MKNLPEWGKDSLPEPLPFSPANALRTIGPGAILLATSIGGGEWLAGPALTVQYGPQILWIVTAAILLQLVLNLEAIRYTLYTGEPALTGIMRLRPGPRFWGMSYIVLAIAQLGIPALAASCSSVIFAALSNRMPVAADAGALNWITYALLAVTVAILLFGGTIERMLEYASWAMIVFIFLFLIIVNVLFVPLAAWGSTLVSFFQFGSVPAGIDLLLLATLAATAGSGGIGNLAISNWVRDKGFGMGGKVGAIPSAFGGRHITLSKVGKVFPIDEENMRRWRVWWKYVGLDQKWLWCGGCFLGMYLNVNLAMAMIPAGTDLSHVGAGAFQAHYMAERLWSGFWILALLNGFWILFSTHLGNTDILIRTVTDILWVSSGKRSLFGIENIRKLYYALLIGFTIWSAVAVNFGHAMTLFKALGTIAGGVVALASVQLLIVNTALLPKELQPSLFRRGALISCAVFYGVLSVIAVSSLLG